MRKAIAAGVLWSATGISGMGVLTRDMNFDLHLSDVAFLSVAGAAMGPVTWAIAAMRYMPDPIIIHRKPSEAK